MTRAGAALVRTITSGKSGFINREQRDFVKLFFGEQGNFSFDCWDQGNSNLLSIKISSATE